MRIRSSFLAVPLTLVALAPTDASAGHGKHTPDWIRPAPEKSYPIIEDAWPALVWLETGEVTLTNCDPGTTASGRNCSDVFGGDVMFPALGDDTLGTAVSDALTAAYAAYDVTFASERPGFYVPYTMLVLASGDDPAMMNQCSGGFINCDGLRRNDIRFRFRECMGEMDMAPPTDDEMPVIMVRALANVFGVEITEAATTPDWMADMDLSNMGREFSDACNMLQEFPPEDMMDPPWQPICDSQHRQFCDTDPDGKLQNSHAELQAMFGDKTMDTEAPSIDSLTPSDGDMFAADEVVNITAMISDNAERIGVGFRLTCVSADGCGADFAMGDIVLDKCTSPDGCDLDFSLNKPVADPWDFVDLDGAPGGDYEIFVGASDYHGNATEQTITITIEGGGGDGDGGTDTGDGGDDGGDDGADDGGDGDTGTGTGDGGDATGDDSKGGCGCTADRPFGLASLPLLLVAGLGLRRRR